MSKTYTITKTTIRLLMLAVLYASVPLWGRAQSIDVERMTKLKKKEWVKINGGVSANTTLFSSNEQGGQQPFSYQLSGNVNLSFLELLNIPLTFSLNNYGSQFTYPTLPNRLSLHPSYKWIRCHIGDVSMSFSPYTLNGHQFTGAGVELAPGQWAVSVMGGRLMKRVEYDPTLPALAPAYERYGYGAKTRYDSNKFFVGATFFTAKDKAGEFSFQADSMGLFPKSNVAMSVEAGISLIPNLKLSGEYAVSLLTQDTRSPRQGHGFIDRLTRNRESTRFYYAVKGALDYTFFKNTIGLGYERICPQYETLGAYYFNNDYENMTLNYARPLFNGKANIALSAGLQRDDLDNTKKEKNTKIIGSVNLSYAPTDKLNLSLSASTFQGHRNIKSQFDYINETAPYQNLDTLNFTQISQNIDMNINWTMQQNEKRTQSLMVNVSYQEAADKQGDYILPGNLTRFLNSSTVYGLELPAANMNINAGFNFSNNYSNLKNYFTYGPTASVSIGFFKRTLTTGMTLSYNRSQEESTPTADVFNCRWNANFTFFKRHGLQADLLFQQRNLMAANVSKEVHSLTTTFSYFYSF